jgi:hypothetical protein
MLGRSDVEKLLILAVQRVVSSRGLSFVILLTIIGYCIYDFVPIVGDEIVRPLAQEAGANLKLALFGQHDPLVQP